MTTRNTRTRFWTGKDYAFVRLHYGPLAKQPWPTRRIAETLGASLWSVYGIARHAGLAWRQCRALDEDAALRLYQQGLPDRAIAWKLDLAMSTITQWRARHWLPSNGYWSKTKRAEAMV